MTPRRHPRVFALAASIILLAACSAPKPPPPPAGPQPPVAAVHPFEVQSPNGIRIDDYYWLRDDTRSKPAVLDYLKAENAYYAAMTAHTRTLEDTLYNEIVGRIKQDDSTVPAKYKHYFYYTRFEQGGEYPVYARRKGRADGVEQVMLDGNAMARGHDFFQIGGQEISPNEQILAFGEDTTGRRQYTIHFKDLATGRSLPDTLPRTPAAMAWADDNKTIFYVENDPITLLSVRVKKHVLGTDPARDPVVYEERDHSYYMDVHRSGDDKYIVIDEQSTLSSELHFAPDRQAEGQVPRAGAARARLRIPRRPHRPALGHPHELERAELPHHAGRRSPRRRRKRMARIRARARGVLISGLRCSATSWRSRSTATACAASGSSPWRRRCRALRDGRRCRLHGEPRRKPRTGHRHAALQLHLADNAEDRSTTST